jgi:hypothetical protein
MTHLFAIALMAGSFVSAACAEEAVHEPALQEITFTHEHRADFYDHAPEALSAIMAPLVERFCEDERGAQTLPPNVVSSLCEASELQYFRGGYDNGLRTNTGIACPKRLRFKNLRWRAAEKLIAKGKCALLQAELQHDPPEQYVISILDKSALYDTHANPSAEDRH